MGAPPPPARVPVLSCRQHRATTSRSPQRAVRHPGRSRRSWAVGGANAGHCDAPWCVSPTRQWRAWRSPAPWGRRGAPGASACVLSIARQCSTGPQCTVRHHPSLSRLAPRSGQRCAMAGHCGRAPIPYRATSSQARYSPPKSRPAAGSASASAAPAPAASPATTTCPGYFPHPRRFLAPRVPYGNGKGVDEDSSQDRSTWRPSTGGGRIRASGRPSPLRQGRQRHHVRPRPSCPSPSRASCTTTIAGRHDHACGATRRDG